MARAVRVRKGGAATSKRDGGHGGHGDAGNMVSAPAPEGREDLERGGVIDRAGSWRQRAENGPQGLELEGDQLCGHSTAA